MIRASLVASIVLLSGHAYAGSVLDLSEPQQGPFPSYLDLNDGKPSSWGETRPRKEASAEPSPAIQANMPAPLPLSSLVVPAKAAPIPARASSPASGSRTLVVVSSTQREYVRSQPASRGFSLGRRRR